MGAAIRWGILGTGGIANQVAQSFQWVTDAQLVAVSSRDLSRAQSFALHHDIPKSYGNYNELCDDDDLDIVYIATPSMRHHDDALMCIRAGKAVLCEKPFTLNALQAREVVDAARARGVFCMEAMWMRFLPLIQDVKARVDRGELGEIRHLMADFGYPQGFDPTHRSFNLELGGGCLLDRGLYPLSLAFYLLGPPQDIESEADIGPSGVDMRSEYHLRYRTGAAADLAATFNAFGSNQATLIGTQGTLRLHAPFYKPHRMSLSSSLSGKQVSPKRPRQLTHMALYQGIKHRFDRGLSALAGPRDLYQPIRGNGYQYEIAAVTQCLQHNQLEHEQMSLDETVDLLKAMDQMRQQWGVVYPSEGSI